jgi:hypothetical protein
MYFRSFYQLFFHKEVILVLSPHYVFDHSNPIDILEHRLSYMSLLLQYKMCWLFCNTGLTDKFMHQKMIN